MNDTEGVVDKARAVSDAHAYWLGAKHELERERGELRRWRSMVARTKEGIIGFEAALAKRATELTTAIEVLRAEKEKC